MSNESTGEDLDERRRAEIEFVSAAYEPSEAWCEQHDAGVDLDDSSWIVNRRLTLPATTQGEKDTTESVSLILHMLMPVRYPAHAALEITGHVENTPHCKKASRLVKKTCHDALPNLLETCRKMASSLIGEEAVFGVLGRADEWIQEDWPRYLSLATTTSSTGAQSTLEAAVTHRKHDSTAVLTRILIYSHHIISKKKRADMKQLANKYNLTGYIKIGWPGLMILEGLNQTPHEFYDEIRRWNWKYLVVRGEMQESATVTDSSSSDEQGGGNMLDQLNSLRRFEKFVEVDDMSVVATACREADLEDLFRTSMKVYKDSITDSSAASSPTEEEPKPYGVLAHVDHMNDAKGYFKWLRKNCSELDVCLAIKQLIEKTNVATTRTSENSSVGQRTNIIVCLVGEKADVSSILKRWRTSRVDVDARGKPCLERMMTVLVEGFLERAPSSRIDWEQHQRPFHVNNHDTERSSTNQRECNNPIELVQTIGGQTWVDSLQTLHSGS